MDANAAGQTAAERRSLAGLQAFDERRAKRHSLLLLSDFFQSAHFRIFDFNFLVSGIIDKYLHLVLNEVLQFLHLTIQTHL